MFPSKWRGLVFMINFHGRRINVDRLERHGSGYVARHEGDFAFFGDPWFRGVDLIQAPDGGIYISDWCDAGECHEEDGVHRSSGRIFKITYAPSAGDAAQHNDPGSDARAASRRLPDVAGLADNELLQLQLSENDWLARTSRRVLQERMRKGDDFAPVKKSLWDLLQNKERLARRPRLLYTCLLYTSD